MHCEAIARAVTIFAPSYNHGLWILSLVVIVVSRSIRAIGPVLATCYLIVKCLLKNLQYLLNLAIYRLLFSILIRFPGPKLRALTRLLYIVFLLKGNLTHEIRKIYEEYSDAVRIASNQVSFATPDAWHDIHTNRSGQKPFIKNPL